MVINFVSRDLVVTPTGRDLCSGLVESLIQRYLGDSASTDAISSKLREVNFIHALP